MLKAVCDNAQRQCLGFGDGLFTRQAVSHNAGQFNNLCNPAAIVFLLAFESEVQFAPPYSTPV